jgi:hypothetical protein
LRSDRENGPIRYPDPFWRTIFAVMASGERPASFVRRTTPVVAAAGGHRRPQPRYEDDFDEEPDDDFDSDLPDEDEPDEPDEPESEEDEDEEDEEDDPLESDEESFLSCRLLGPSADSFSSRARLRVP